jgi:NAD(P)-dependent dehydrogenase (short-subunit alcohol dehydrogenase family)
MMKRTIVVVGAGPGVSASVARRFARDGYDVALLGNEAEPLAILTGELMSSGATVRSAVVDVTDTALASRALRDPAGGAVDVPQFNPSAFRQKDPLELQVDELLADVARRGRAAHCRPGPSARPAIGKPGRRDGKRSS